MKDEKNNFIENLKKNTEVISKILEIDKYKDKNENNNQEKDIKTRDEER